MGNKGGIWTEEDLLKRVEERAGKLAKEQEQQRKRIWNYEVGCINPYVNFMYIVQTNGEYKPREKNATSPPGMKREMDRKDLTRMILTKPSLPIPFKDYIRLKTILRKEKSLPGIIVGISNWEKVSDVLKQYMEVYKFKDADEFVNLFECTQNYMEMEPTPKKKSDFSWVKTGKEQTDALLLTCPDPPASLFGKGKKKAKNYTMQVHRVASHPATKAAAVIGLGAAGMRYAKRG